MIGTAHHKLSNMPNTCQALLLRKKNKLDQTAQPAYNASMIDHAPDVIECVQCGDTVPDYYRGPIGHAPSNLCWSCWCIHWATRAIIEKGSEVSQFEAALYLIAHGFSQRETSTIIGRNRRTLTRWIEDIRDGRRQIPQWLANPTEVRRKIKHYKTRGAQNKAA